MSLKADLTAALFSSSSDGSDSSDDSVSPQDRLAISSLRGEIAALKDSISSTARLTARCLAEEKDLKSATTALLRNQRELVARHERKEKEREEMLSGKQEEIEELEAQMRDLKSFISISKQTKNSEVEGGDVLGLL